MHVLPTAPSLEDAREQRWKTPRERLLNEALCSFPEARHVQSRGEAGRRRDEGAWRTVACPFVLEKRAMADCRERRETYPTTTHLMSLLAILGTRQVFWCVRCFLQALGACSNENIKTAERGNTPHSSLCSTATAASRTLLTAPVDVKS